MLFFDKWAGIVRSQSRKANLSATKRIDSGDKIDSDDTSLFYLIKLTKEIMSLAVFPSNNVQTLTVV